MNSSTTPTLAPKPDAPRDARVPAELPPAEAVAGGVAIAQLAGAGLLLTWGFQQSVLPAEKLLVFGLAVGLLLSAVPLAWLATPRTLGCAAVAVEATLVYWAVRACVAPSGGPRLMAVAAGGALAAALLQVVAHYALRWPARRAAMVSFGLATALVAVEGLLPRWIPRLQVRFLESPIATHPELGWTNRPLGRLRLAMADNPDHYFQTAGQRPYLTRELDPFAFDGSQLEVILPEQDDGVLRALPRSAETVGLIQCNLNYGDVHVRGGRTYHVELQARADQPRAISIDCLQAEQPYAMLGLNETIELTTEWQDVRLSFVAKADELRARLKVNVGKGSVPVELRHVTFDAERLGARRDTAAIFLDHPVNEHGFRGRAVDGPAELGMFRLALLGDESAFGLGVRSEDVLSRQLETLLNDSTAPSGGEQYEALNLGVLGYGAAEMLHAAEVWLPKLRPQTVVAVLSPRCDSAPKQRRLERSCGEAGSGQTFLLWRVARESLRSREAFGYASLATDVAALRETCARNGANLAVVLFRLPGDAAGDRLAEAARQGISGLPLLDLGPVLERDTSGKSLQNVGLNLPNAAAHRRAAEALRAFLETERLLAPPAR